jgi:hypothetical protein
MALKLGDEMPDFAFETNEGLFFCVSYTLPASMNDHSF